MPTQSIRLADLATRKPTEFAFCPDQAQRAAIAEALNIQQLRKMTFTGEISPKGRADWHIVAQLGATVTQSCVVTLEPVSTRIDEAISRHYAADYEEPDGSEVEMPEDDSIEPIPATLDIAAIAIEALSLALPAFPRAADADLGEAIFTEPGTDAMTDDDAKPFAGLSALRDALKKDNK